MQETPAKIKIRFVIDAIVGLVVFLVLSAATLGPSAASSLLGIENTVSTVTKGSTALPLFVPQVVTAWDISGTNVKFLMLAAVFSTLFALNKAFVRHLRKAYIASHKVLSKLDRE
jgi:Gpi18-like mannosyltransferase